MLQAVDKEVLNQVQDWLAAETACWLATVVQTWGSSPRPVGSLLTCNADGVVVGSLSGGCVEDDLLEKLTTGELAADGPQFFQYGITAEETEKLGLPCGGHLYIVVEALRPDEATLDHFFQLTSALAKRQCAKRAIDLKSGVTTVCGRTVKASETTPGVNYVVMDWAGEVPWVVWHRGPRGVVSDPVTLSQPKSR